MRLSLITFLAVGLAAVATTMAQPELILPEEPVEIPKVSFPEVVGMTFAEAQGYILKDERSEGIVAIMEVGPGMMVTQDYRLDRIRIYVDDSGIVTRTPVNA
uniref:Peptidase inhibitor I78 family protein n=1 Tax=Phaeomonas parva TaxID=124430 RepID=A0A7S1U8Z9_9STRA|mmetsp:Transcript_37331/g.116731  ORF Transcript_37331/g.116731 Transcript_37331/m.116731 type:complete len:102 (+) Transcript_37331:705-1010(+)